MEYKVVYFHPDVKDTDGASGAASQLEALINKHAREGWEYYRMEGMRVELIATGCNAMFTSKDAAKTKNLQLIVFRK
tara:strand:- start:127 stop:357 length:231 start_codon:yes stop_codon:yes gene_type:complete